MSTPVQNPSETEEELEDEIEETDNDLSEETEDEEVEPKWVARLRTELQAQNQQLQKLERRIAKLTPKQQKELKQELAENPNQPVEKLVLNLENKTQTETPSNGEGVDPEKKEAQKAKKLGQIRREKRLANKTKNKQ